MYESTRGNLERQTASQAIAWGMVPGGGLFVPEVLPALNWKELRELSYQELAERIMSLFLPDMPPEVISKAAAVYGGEVFEGADPAPLKTVGHFSVLELWHGPTAAFKDMALQVLPHLLGASVKQVNQGAQVLILTATSGDTGKAALEGFKNVPGTSIMVFYPDGGVSAVQERQMTTTDGSNTYVVAVDGNFDQCQSAVKEIFASEELRSKLAQKNMIFSSANSINWGRLLPQIVYYVWTYLQAVEQEKIEPGAPLNVVVPTGNFGNILAGYYAKKMGIPLGQLICASNKNKVLTDFFETGVYDTQRAFHLTISPSMDILISSNFERFLYEMCAKDPEKIKAWYQSLSASGVFKVDEDTLKNSRQEIWAGWADENDVLAVIARAFKEHRYVYDPHTAVAVKVYEDYVRASGDHTYTAIVSTASPFKFASSVLEAISGSKSPDEWEALARLEQETGWKIPTGLKGLNEKPEQRVQKCEPQGLKEVLLETYHLNDLS
ncbi:threonine synthase [Paradesulfitobacterium ferrireducens]|uniref:threonine synthase n=1 Tax=Paradesulfitobacterium ferrireducens TaxID=2816476 RepID=UPI001A90B2D1|nr:threonine synthase [Paradesulfitobacterium ferrireducens]